MRLPRLKEVRELHGWSQAKLAEESGVSRDSISNYETGQREAWPATAKKLADALGVEIAELREPAGELAASGKAEASREARPLSVIEVVLAAAKNQDTANWQAIARAKESAPGPQLSTVAHENTAFRQLLEYPPGNVAEGFVDLARRYVQEVAELREEVAEQREENARLRDQLQERERAHS